MEGYKLEIDSDATPEPDKDHLETRDYRILDILNYGESAVNQIELHNMVYLSDVYALETSIASETEQPVTSGFGFEPTNQGVISPQLRDRMQELMNIEEVECYKENFKPTSTKNLTVPSYTRSWASGDQESQEFVAEFLDALGDTKVRDLDDLIAFVRTHWAVDETDYRNEVNLNRSYWEGRFEPQFLPTAQH